MLLFAASIRTRLLDLPLERDEGEYAYAGQLLLEGVPPYRLAYNMKLPGIYGTYALIMAVFGQTAAGIHSGLLVVNAATTVLVFLLARRLADSRAGVVASATYAVLSASPSVVGMAAHATHFVVLPALGGLLLLLRARDRDGRWTVFWSGLLLGLAFIMKQPGGLLVAFALLYLAWIRAVRKSALLLAAAVIPFGLSCLLLFLAGVFDRFWFWTFTYAREYATAVPLSLGFLELLAALPGVMGPSLVLWVWAGIGLSALCWDRDVRANGTFVAGFALFSFLAVCPGFYFRDHYFVLVLPAIALLAGVAVSAGRRVLRRMRCPATVQVLPLLVFVVSWGYSVWEQRAFFFEMTPRAISRTKHGANPFPESLEIARYVQAHSAKDDRVAVLGSEPQIYFYSHRKSATGHIYTYGLMEPQKHAVKMQQEMIDEIEAARPEYLIYANVRTSWLARPESERRIFTWYNQYSRKQYELVGVIEILSFDRTEYRWGGQAKGYSRRSPNFLLVHRRKPSGA